MAPKYSHVKKRPTPRKKQSNKDKDDSIVISGNPHVDRNLTQAFSAVSKLERTIARILLLRYEQDIARLFSTRLYTVSLVHLPTLVMRCVSLGGPGWAAHNADSEEIKDFFRAVISMDMRQAGERVATKSVLWSYTALRHFALSNNVPICQKRGLHSLRLLPHYDALKAHLDSLEAQPIPQFSKPPHLGPLLEGESALEEACEIKFGLKSPNGKSKKGKNKGKGKENENQNESDVNRDRDKGKGTGMGKGSDKYTPPYSDPSGDPYDPDWRPKVLLSYEKLVQTLWRVAKEFDVRGYGLMLREKLTSKWCDCGCSTDHLGEVCERTVREEEEWVYERAQMQGHLHPHSHSNAHSHSLGCGAPRGKGKGKQREWDGRGSGVFGWDTSEEEDIWEVELDFGGGPGPGPGGFGHRDEDVEADGSDDDNDDEGHEHGRRHPHGNGHGHRSKQRRDKDKVLESKPKQQQQSANPSPHEIALSDLPLSEMSISEIMEFRYLRAEKEKELGNAAFRKGDYLTAVEYYEKAYGIEKEMPTYQLNLGMAWLRLEDWIKAEEACTKALTQHRSPKGYFRRAKARKMLGRTEDAARDLRAVLKLQPTNMEARKELLSLYPPPLPTATTPDSVALNQARDRENANAGSGCVSGPSSSIFGSSSTSVSGSSSLPSSQTNASSALPSDNQRSSHPLLPTIKSPKALPFPRTSMDDRKMKIVQFPAGLSLDSQVLDLVEGGMGPLGASSSGTPAAAGFFGGMMGGMMGGVVGGWAIGSLSGVGGLTPTNYYYANGYGDVDYGKEGGKGGKDGARDGHAHPHTQGGHVNVRGPHGYGCTCANRGRGGRGGEKTGVNGEKREKTREEKERADRAWNRQKDLEKLRATPGVMYPGWERYVVKRAD